MTNNNNLLYNAALAGFLAGAYAGTYPTGLTSGQVSLTLGAAEAWAKEFDLGIPNDTSISGANGVTLPPTTAAITSAQNAKTSLAYSLAQSFSSGRNSTDGVAADYAAAAASAVVIYTAGIGGFTIG